MRIGRIIYISIIVVLLIGIVGEYYWFTSKEQTTVMIEDKEGIVATVDNQNITEKEFYSYLKNLYGKEALEEMINSKIVKLTAEKYGVEVSSTDIDRRYREFMNDFESEKEFLKYLNQELGMTKEQLYEYLESDLLWEEVAIKDVNISEDDLLTYYEEHESNYIEPEKYHLEQIVVSNMEEAKEVVSELENGSDFNTLAKERSLDVLSVASGGDLGYLRSDNLSISPLVFAEAKNMAINDVSIVQLEDSVTVIRLLDYKDEVKYSFEEVKGEIRREFALSKVNSIPEVLQKLKKDIEVNILDPSLKK